VLILGSDYEGFGLVLLEAMAAERPVLASRVSAIPEIVLDQETGILVPPRDAGAMVNGMRTLLDSNLRVKFGKAGRQRVKAHFNTAKMIDLTQAAYQKVTEI
jgi:glycosyltransferase involved in cell wall biosynthesis